MHKIGLGSSGTQMNGYQVTNSSIIVIPLDYFSQNSSPERQNFEGIDLNLYTLVESQANYNQVIEALNLDIELIDLEREIGNNQPLFNMIKILFYIYTQKQNILLCQLVADKLLKFIETYNFEAIEIVRKCISDNYEILSLHYQLKIQKFYGDLLEQVTIILKRSKNTHLNDIEMQLQNS